MTLVHQITLRENEVPKKEHLSSLAVDALVTGAAELHL